MLIMSNSIPTNHIQLLSKDVQEQIKYLVTSRMIKQGITGVELQDMLNEETKEFTFMEGRLSDLYDGDEGYVSIYEVKEWSKDITVTVEYYRHLEKVIDMLMSNDSNGFWDEYFHFSLVSIRDEVNDIYNTYESEGDKDLADFYLSVVKFIDSFYDEKGVDYEQI